MMSAKGYQNLLGSEDGKNVFWATDVNVELPIKMRQTGNASFQPKTLSEVFVETSFKQPERPAIYVERAGKEIKWTWKEY